MMGFELAEFFEHIEAISALVGVVWIVMGLLLSFAPRYDDVPIRYGGSYVVVGSVFVTLSLATFARPSQFGYVLASFAGSVLLLTGVAGFRWLVREYAEGTADHDDYGLTETGDSGGGSSNDSGNERNRP